jgi:hypothetical protein
MKKTFLLGGGLLLFSSGMMVLTHAQPAWWVQRGVYKTGAEADDFAVVNQGQLKNFALATYHEFEARLPGGAGPTLTALITSWNTPSDGRDDYAAVTQGQVKALADLFFARLDAVRAQIVPTWPVVQPPWTSPTPGTPAPNHAAVANIGQVKHVFSLLEGDRSLRSLGALAGTDLSQAGLQFGLGWLEDSDGDGVSDLDELLDEQLNEPDQQINPHPSLQLFSHVYETVALGN